MASERRLYLFILTHFLHANRYPPRIKSGAGFRWKTLYGSGTPIENSPPATETFPFAV